MRDLVQQLREMPPRPPLRLVSPLSLAAQQLAEEVAAAAWRRNGTELSPLGERLRPHGKWTGAGGEVKVRLTARSKSRHQFFQCEAPRLSQVYSVRQPEAMVAMLLMGDGDPTRRNRAFLLRGDLKVAGAGLASHHTAGSVGVLTLVSMFTRFPFPPTKVEARGLPIKPAFQEVLDAIPSEQARAVATDSLAQGKKVVVDYERTGVSITVHEPGGRKSITTIKV